MSTDITILNKKTYNKIKILLEYDGNNLEFLIDSEKSLKNFKEEFFYPIKNDIKFFYTDELNLTQFEEEKLFILFKDKKEVKLKAIQNKEMNGDKISSEFSKNTSEKSPSSQEYSKYFNCKSSENSSNDIKYCVCKKTIGEYFCRKCMVLLCETCKENVKWVFF